MELKDYLKLLHKELELIISTAAFFAAIGVIVYFVIPPKYVASGTFFVGRAVGNPNGNSVATSTSSNSIDYEGYYASQASITYADSFSNILTSIEIQRLSLDALNKPIKEVYLRKLAKNTKVTRESNIVKLEVTAKTGKEALNTYHAVANNSIVKFKAQASRLDSNILVSKIYPDPVIYKEFSSVFLAALIGLVLGALASITYISVKDYFEREF